MKDFPYNNISANNYSGKPISKTISIDQYGSDRKKPTEGSNKTFFSNIKAELNNIRSDVNKLVSKDIPRSSISINRSYTNSSAQKNENWHTSDVGEKLLDRKIGQSNDTPYVSQFGNESKIIELSTKLNEESSRNNEMRRQLEEKQKNEQNLIRELQNSKQYIMKIEEQLLYKNSQIEVGKKKEGNYQDLFRQQSEKIKLLEGEIERLKTQVKVGKDNSFQSRLLERQQIIENLNNQVINLCEANEKLLARVANFEKEKQIQVVSIINNYEEKFNRSQAKSFKELGSNFQLKINQLLDQNYSLKNKITSLQSQIEEEMVIKRSLQSTIQIYESRDREVVEKVNDVELERLRRKIMELQEQNDRLQSDHEFEILKLENKIDELRSNNQEKGENKSFNQILKDQINEIENLKEKLRQKSEMINRLKK